MDDDLFRLNSTLVHAPEIDEWFRARSDIKGQLAHRWFSQMRKCGNEFREVIHDGCPTACFGEFPFAYVNVFNAHVNVGFFQGATLPDPHRLLIGSGKRMRHVKLIPGENVDETALGELISAAYAHIKSRVENG